MNTIWLSFKEAFCMFLKTKFLFGSATCVFGIPFIAKNYLDIDKWLSIKYAAIAITAYFLIVFFLRLWENYKKWFSNHFFDSIWGDGLLLVQEVHELVRLYEIDNSQRDEYLKKFCNLTKQYFDKLTKKNCNVSIKLPKVPAPLEEFEVENVCRDSKSTCRDTDLYKAQKHLILQNTAYTTILARLVKGKKNAIYINNHIDESTYESTSTPAYENEQLPYKSEMVTAIRKYPYMRPFGGSTELRGFLCIDSESENTFSNDRYYVCVVNLLSDSLYRIVQPNE